MEENNENVEVINEEPIEKPKGKKLLIFSFVMSIILFVIALLYYILPLIYLFFAGVYLLLTIVVIVVPTVCTLFLILLNDEFRAWAGSAWGYAEKLVKGQEEIPKFAPYLGYFLWAALIVAVLVMTQAFLKLFKTKTKGYIVFIVFSGIFITLLVAMIVSYYVNGMQFVL